MTNIILISIIIFLCLIIFLLIVRQKPKYDGVLLIDTSDPEKDIFRLELNTLQGIDQKKTILLKVASNVQIQDYKK